MTTDPFSPMDLPPGLELFKGPREEARQLAEQRELIIESAMRHLTKNRAEWFRLYGPCWVVVGKRGLLGHGVTYEAAMDSCSEKDEDGKHVVMAHVHGLPPKRDYKKLIADMTLAELEELENAIHEAKSAMTEPEELYAMLHK
jgi:hypothetical protein